MADIRIQIFLGKFCSGFLQKKLETIFQKEEITRRIIMSQINGNNFKEIGKASLELQ